MRKFCKDCIHEPVCGSPHTEHTLGCDYWQKETSDAVPVVRCGGCELRNKNEDFPFTVWCPWLGRRMGKADYCSYGERRADGNNE